MECATLLAAATRPEEVAVPANHVINAVRLAMGLSLLAGCPGKKPVAPLMLASFKDIEQSRTWILAGNTDIQSLGASRMHRMHWVRDCLTRGAPEQTCDLRDVRPFDSAWMPEELQQPPLNPPLLALSNEPLVANEPTGRLVWDVTVPSAPGELNGSSTQLLLDARTGEVLLHQVLPELLWQAIEGRPFADRLAEIRTDAKPSIWLRRAREEHASIASFARHLLEMMAMGAPVDLLQAISKAQLDEVRHTQLCLQRARADGCDAVLGALDTSLPPRLGGLAVALGVALEGCVNETLAATRMAESAQQATGDDAILLAQIAEDETEHACLAWRTLTWLWPSLSADEQHQVRSAMVDATPDWALSMLSPCWDALPIASERLAAR
jgi:hypothetical protein